MSQKKSKSISTHLSRLLLRAEKLRGKRAGLAVQIADIDSEIADLELEWNDVRKEISVSLFGSSAPEGTVTMTDANDVVGASKAKKKRKKKRKPISVRKKSNLGSREEIRAAAEVRDARVLEVIQWAPGMTFQEIALKVNDGTRSQIQTSLKRLREQKKIACVGTGKTSTWKPLGKKGAKKKGKKTAKKGKK